MQRSLSGQVITFLALLFSRLLLACCRSTQRTRSTQTGEPDDPPGPLPPAASSPDLGTRAVEAVEEAIAEVLEEKKHECQDAIRQRKATPPVDPPLKK